MTGEDKKRIRVAALADFANTLEKAGSFDVKNSDSEEHAEEDRVMSEVATLILPHVRQKLQEELACPVSEEKAEESP